MLSPTYDALPWMLVLVKLTKQRRYVNSKNLTRPINKHFTFIIARRGHQNSEWQDALTSMHAPSMSL